VKKEADPQNAIMKAAFRSAARGACCFGSARLADLIVFVASQ
jgi:hypothetical protein